MLLVGRQIHEGIHVADRMHGSQATQAGVDKGESASASAGPMPPPPDDRAYNAGRGDYEIKILSALNCPNYGAQPKGLYDS